MISTVLKTIRISSLVLWSCMWFNSSLQAQYWVQKAGGLTIDEAQDISLDAAGNTYTVGYFTGTANFGSTTLISDGSTDIFVAKNNSQGDFVWAIKAGGTASDRALAVKTDDAGNSYVTGFFNGTATFGSTTLTSAGLQDVFVAKYSPAGVLLWVTQAGGSDAEISFGISIHSSGNVFITGSFKGSASFGATTLVSANTTSDVFTAKLNTSGVFQWAKSGTGNYSNKGTDVGCDNVGNVYVTGQFSDTITFGSMHPNQMQNVIFVIKYDSSGTEQWFKIIGGATTNTVNGIAVDGSGNSYLTGDFVGTLVLYGTPNTTLTNAYSNAIFVAKLSNTGGVQWAHADGSNGSLSATNIQVNASGNAFIAGFFGCKLNDYADQYGQGTFNSVGGTDVFVTKYTSSGAWDYSRNLGSRGADRANGIAVNSQGHVFLAGSFANSLMVPTNSNFLASNLALWTDVSCTGNSPYCSDSDYGTFHSIPTSGNLDILIGNCFPTSRQPYDFYLRTGTGCVRDQTSVCIDTLCPAVVTGCSLVPLTPLTAFCSEAGPSYTYNWSSGVITVPNSPSVSVNVSGTYRVTQTSADGCFSSSDSIQVIVLPGPPKPSITDNKGFNTNAFITTPIKVCNPDSVLLQASNFNNSNIYYWIGPGLPVGGFADSTLTTTLSGTFQFYVIDSSGCETFNQVFVTFYDTIGDFPLKMNLSDSITVCDSTSFSVQLYDSINNPSISPQCITIPNVDIITTFTISPSIPVSTSCGTYGIFMPNTTGWHTITATFVRQNYCYSDTIVLSQQVYITVNPSPYIAPFNIVISGGPFLCPGDTLSLQASGAPNYTWFGPYVNGVSDSTIAVFTSGNYAVGSVVYDTNSFGCTASFSTTAQILIEDKPQPTVTAASSVICPGDSVQLTSSSFMGNAWEGPNGPIADSGYFIYVSDPGYYFTVVNDADSCGLVSASILLTQYTTPNVVAMGDTIICDGDSTIISVQTDTNSIIEWQAPLSGDSTSQVIYTAGTYTVKITSCGIETFASITIYSSQALSVITLDGVLCEDSTLTLAANPGMASYVWFPGGQTTQNITINTGGNYVLSVVDSNGCSSVSDTLTVQEISVPVEISASAFGFCFGDSLVLSGNPGLAGYLWLPTGDTTSSIVLYQPGFFTLIAMDTNGCVGKSEAVEIVMPDTIASVNLSGPTFFCEGETLVLDAETPISESYVWFPGNEQSSSIEITQSGTYAVAVVDTFGCAAYSDSITVQVDSNTLITPTISNDTTVCEGITLVLQAQADSGTIVWYTNIGGLPVFTGPNYEVQIEAPITFFVQTESAVCQSPSAAVTIDTWDCDNINTATIFTPNGDGVNDLFRVQIFGTTHYQVEIFNRWGTLIYFFNHPNQAWDGTMYESGEALPDGVYYYIVNYGKYDGTDVTEKGYVTLMR